MQIEQARPAYVIYGDVSGSWGVRDLFKPKILIWAQNYLARSYEIVRYGETLDLDRPVFASQNIVNSYGVSSNRFWWFTREYLDYAGAEE